MTGDAVPHYDMTGKGFGIQGQVQGTPAPGYTAMWGGGIPKQYAYESTIAGGLVGFDVVFPPSYDSSPNKRYPVIYHLHGKGENHTAYRYNGSLDAKLPTFWTNGTGEFLFISVGGPSDCWWSDGNDGDKAESHIINEVLSVVDQQFRTLGVREGRGIMGFSMGGFGSHKIAIKYPQYFAVGATYCGGTYSAGKYVFGTNEEGFGFGSDFDRIWGTDAEYASRDCGRALLSSKATDVKQRGTGFVIHAGTTDMFYKHNNGFKTQLDGLGISATYTEANHGHDMGSITAQFFNDILSYMASAK